MVFPVTCMDNFYQNPDDIREYALSLDYFRNPGDRYPGVRSNEIHTLNPDFFYFSCKKLFSIFFDLEVGDFNWEVSTCFQKIYPYECSDSNKQDINSGWIHQDSFESILAAVVYLNPIPNLDSGTSIYELKEKYNQKSSNFLQYYHSGIDFRNDFYNHRSKLSEDEYLKKKLEHNSRFEKTLDVKNVYNRIICYPADYFHTQSGFLIDTEDFRLTQVFFVNSIKSSVSSPPYLRCKNV
jgi:hypothetical protein